MVVGYDIVQRCQIVLAEGYTLSSWHIKLVGRRVYLDHSSRTLLTGVFFVRECQIKAIVPDGFMLTVNVYRRVGSYCRSGRRRRTSFMLVTEPQKASA